MGQKGEKIVGDFFRLFRQVPSESQRNLLGRLEKEARQELMTEVELCELLRVGRSTFWKFRKEGSGRGIDLKKIESVIVGRRRMYVRESVRRLFEEGQNVD